MKIDSIIGFHAGAVIAVTDDDKVVRWFPAPEPTEPQAVRRALTFALINHDAVPWEPSRDLECSLVVIAEIARHTRSVFKWG